MKKLLILTLGLLLSMPMVAQNDSIPPQDLSETGVERVIDKYGGKIVDAFNDAVDTVVPIAEDAFNVVVRLQIAKGLGWLVIAIVMISLGIYWLKLGNIQWKRGRDSQDNDNYILATLCYSGSGVLLGVGVTKFLYKAVLHLLAPEWFAIIEIMDLVK